MSLILIRSRTRYPLDRKKVEQIAKSFLNRKGWEDSELSFTFVGQRKIRELNREYRGLDKATTILEFSQIEAKAAGDVFVVPAEKEKLLGDVMICPKEAAKLAATEGVTPEAEIARLVRHGINNLIKAAGQGKPGRY